MTEIPSEVALIEEALQDTDPAAFPMLDALDDTTRALGLHRVFLSMQKHLTRILRDEKRAQALLSNLSKEIIKLHDADLEQIQREIEKHKSEMENGTFTVDIPDEIMKEMLLLAEPSKDKYRKFNFVFSPDGIREIFNRKSRKVTDTWSPPILVESPKDIEKFKDAVHTSKHALSLTTITVSVIFLILNGVVDITDAGTGWVVFFLSNWTSIVVEWATNKAFKPSEKSNYESHSAVSIASNKFNKKIGRPIYPHKPEIVDFTISLVKIQEAINIACNAAMKKVKELPAGATDKQREKTLKSSAELLFCSQRIKQIIDEQLALTVEQAKQAEREEYQLGLKTKKETKYAEQRAAINAKVEELTSGAELDDIIDHLEK